MRASALIDYLQKLVAEHGDLECVDTYDDSIEAPEYSWDGVFVVADKA